VSEVLQKHGYRVLRVLGRHAQDGRVTYLCLRRADSQRVVVKHFSFGRADAHWDGYKAHEREIAALRALDHPAIPRFLDGFETSDGFCLVQEYKDAPSLGAPRTWRFDEILAIAEDLLGVLIYLQRRSPAVIHRDLKPDNILRDEAGRLYLIDFGLARHLGESSASTMSAGTPGFMAPEQFFRLPLTAATDLYGLGATLITLLSDVTSAEVGRLVDTSFRFRLDHLRGAVPAWFLAWLEVLVAPEAERRFPNAARALAALRAAPAAHRAPPAPPAPIGMKAPPGARKKARAGVIVAALVVNLTIALMVFVAIPSAPGPTETAPVVDVAVRGSRAVAAAPEPMRVRGSRAWCTGAASWRLGGPDVPEPLDRVDTEAGCDLRLEGLSLNTLYVAQGSRLHIVGGSVESISAVRADGVGEETSVRIEGATVGRLSLGSGRAEMSDVTVGRVDLNEGTSLVASGLRVGQLRLRGGTATLDGGRVDGYFSLAGDALMRGTDLEVAVRARLSERAVLMLDRAMISEPISKSGDHAIVLLRSPTFTTRVPRLGPHDRTLEPGESLDESLAVARAARDAAMAEEERAAIHAALVKSLEEAACGAVGACFGQAEGAKGRVEALLRADGAGLTVERATVEAECVARRVKPIEVPGELAGRVRCAFDLSASGGARLLTPRINRFEADR